MRRSALLRAVGPIAVLGAVIGVPAAYGQAMDSTAAMAAPAKVYGGAFRGIDNHNAEGRYTLLQRDGKYVLEFAESFKFDRIPDGYVVLSNRPNAIDGSSVFVAKFTTRRGAQTYILPQGVDPSQFRYVLVWCKKYAVPVGAAPLL